MTVTSLIPSDPILDIEEVRRESGNQSRSTLWRQWRKGEFPKPIPISPGRVGWLKSEIDAWKLERMSRRNNGEKAA